ETENIAELAINEEINLENSEEINTIIVEKPSFNIKANNNFVTGFSNKTHAQLATTNISNQNASTGYMETKWENGDYYLGDYVRGKRTGEGLYIWENGNRYEGQFLNGKRYGNGTYIWENGDRYEGDYVNDKRHGTGTYIWNNGDYYKGNFIAGKRYGQGKLVWIDGEIYEGGFINNHRAGKGVYISSGGDRYDGYFENGKRVGKGIFTSITGSPRVVNFKENQYTLKNVEFKNGVLISIGISDEKGMVKTIENDKF
ncbi:MAG: hypothetical protein KAH84_09970, partial [Thiomargarita sp.]|nr:hypothetical protein [Thiomargarita sp.]